jgi:hypothetical protein
MDVKRLVRTIKDRLKQGAAPGRVVDNVAAILEQESQPTIKDWLQRVDAESHILTIHMPETERSATCRNCSAT